MLASAVRRRTLIGSLSQDRRQQLFLNVDNREFAMLRMQHARLQNGAVSIGAVTMGKL
jgi:hypothetical protein